ncbi:MAG: ATP-binding protein [Gammaproteobacteria bacterium]|nr:ATP-binding protein [Gammaproteobacteria bacterium]
MENPTQSLQQKLLTAIERAQSHYIDDGDSKTLFNGMLSDVLDFTESEYGFIGEIHYKDGNIPYLKTHAITNIAWNDETREFYAANAPSGLEFYNLDSLFGEVIKTGKAVISNDPSNDLRGAGTPEGHPPLKAFLGAPIYRGSQFVGMLGIANRAVGYDDQLLEQLQPLLRTCGSLIAGYRDAYNRQEAENILQKQGEFLRSVLSTINEAILTFDQRGYINSNNPAAEEMFGLSQDKLKTCTLFDLILDLPINFTTHHHDADNQILTKMVEYTGKHSSGHTFPLELAITPLKLDGHQMYTGVGRDISERQQSNRIKNEFISTISHELRTPLTTIEGALKLLADKKVSHLSPDQVTEMLDAAQSSSERLQKLINDILEIQQLEFGDFMFEPELIQVHDFLNQVVRRTLDLALQKGIRLKVDNDDTELYFRIDLKLLLRVMDNLLNNALHYAEPDSEVTLNTEKNGAYARITVTNKGNTIPEEVCDSIFDVFFQVDSGDTRQPGKAGLGLSIAKSIIERHHGQIYVKSTQEEGTRFFFDLPLFIQERLTNENLQIPPALSKVTDTTVRH